MNRRLFSLIGVIALLIGLGLAACGNDNNNDNDDNNAESSPTPTENIAETTPLLDLLRYIPDTPEVRAELVYYGDMDAWHTSWDVPRVENMDELDALDRVPRAYWLSILPYQTVPSTQVQSRYYMHGTERAFYGFDLFNVDRFITASIPPDAITVVEYNLDQAQITGTLTASGYEPQALEPDGTLYSLVKEYERGMWQDPNYEGDSEFGGPSLMLGPLNRIAFVDERMLIARETDPITEALATHRDDTPSLADDPIYQVALQALQDPSLADVGELIGVIFMEGEPILEQDPLTAMIRPGEASPEQIAALREKYGLDRPFRYGFDLLAFVTHHTEGASYLTLVAVFLPDKDASDAAEAIAEGIESYVSFSTRAPLSDYWTVDRATNREIDGVQVALVTMRVDDPPPTPDDQEQVNTAVFSWIRLVPSLDLGFLSIREPAEEE